ncbi:YadA-like family protein [Mannheimia varigena]|uniref:YadA-like family protein n=1 Tax=Mannheimia varigena TaxID=85404 RepID=UPI0015B74B0D|nr:YadA-like family protein [Mannheimia varigena]QLD33892.1 YadA-like family protein [Mannheimia varigena]
MNKIYMVKRNAYGQPVVCSEKTKARGKVKSIVLAVATASAMMASVDVLAATATGTGTAVVDGDTTGAIAITSQGAATATGENSIAIGEATSSLGTNTIVIGENSSVIQTGDIVIGKNNKLTAGIDYGTLNGKNNIVLGNDNTHSVEYDGWGGSASEGTIMIGSNNSMGGANSLADVAWGINNSAIIGQNSAIGSAIDGGGFQNMYIMGTGSAIAVQSCGTAGAQNIQILGSNSTVTGEMGVDTLDTDFKVNSIGYHNRINIGASTELDGYTYSDFNILGNNNNVGDYASQINVIGSGNLVGSLKTSTLGFNNTISSIHSAVVGNKNTISGENIFAVGNNITTATNMSVVLGTDSASYESGTATAGRVDYPSYTIKDTTYNFAGTTPHNIISVGATGKEGRIQNVASGLISSTSTDAINGSQLYAVVSAVNAIKTTVDTVSDTNTQASVTSDQGIVVTESDNANGTKNYTVSAKLGDGLSFDENGAIKASGTSITAGDNIQVSGDTKNGFVISATDTNTQSSSSAVNGKGLTVTTTDNANGTKNYAFEAKIGDGLVFGDNGEIKATGTTLTAGDNITVEGDATNGYTIKATNTQSVVKAGNGVTVDVADNDIGTKDYTVSTKIGDGLTFGSNGEIKATGTIINAGDNITVTGDALNGYTISTKGGITDEQLQDVINQINGIVDTNTQSTTSAGQGIVVTETDNANGTKNYAVSIKATDGLTFDDNGNIKVSDTLVKAGDNVQVSGNAKDGFTVSAKGTEITAGDNVNVSGDAKNGYTISVENMRTTVTGGQGAEVTSSDNADGSKNYTVNVKVGEGLTYDDKGNLVNDMKLTAGENVQVSGDAKGGYTISATDTNTQATVSADKGITITETNNANGTKNYAVSAKLGKGLKVDENGAIAATAQPINGGAGVSITTNSQDEAVVNVAGVTTTTDDGKSYTRSDLTKPVGVKGDGKNIRTSTAANDDVQVKLADDIQVNSVTIHNGPTINQQGINAANTRITNVQDGVAPTDAVNVRQLNQQGNIINQRIDNLADNVKKNKKRNDAGIASTAAMANIPQVMLAGKSGVGVGVGHRSGQNAIAVGYSRASDNAKHIIKLSAGLDTQSKATFGAGYMYQW